MIAFIHGPAGHRKAMVREGMIIAPRMGSGSICKVLQIAPSGYYARLAVRSDQAKASVRQRTDAALRPKIRRVWDDNWQVYGVRKGEPLKAPLVQAQWRTRQLCREGEDVARCTVARLMASMGLIPMAPSTDLCPST